jgi:hypothetical protein
MSGHFYQDSTSQINFGWTAQQNSPSYITCVVIATRSLLSKLAGIEERE